LHLNVVLLGTVILAPTPADTGLIWSWSGDLNIQTWNCCVHVTHEILGNK